MDHLERRSSARIPIECKVGYYYMPPSTNPPAFRALNLSLTGACLESPVLLIPGASVSFHLITSENRMADISAEIIHSEPANSSMYHVGVQFMPLAEYDRTILAREIERATKTFQ